MKHPSQVSVIFPDQRWSGSGPVAVQYWVIWGKWSTWVVHLGGLPISLKGKMLEVLSFIVKETFIMDQIHAEIFLVSNKKKNFFTSLKVVKKVGWSGIGWLSLCGQNHLYLWIGWFNLHKLGTVGKLRLSDFQRYQICEDWTSQSRNIDGFMPSPLPPKFQRLHLKQTFNILFNSFEILCQNSELSCANKCGVWSLILRVVSPLCWCCQN